jgi:UDP:flavonoid glycosyltransferase YjiC (YdhE family)
LKFVITSFGSLGDLNPYVGLGRALKARGHDVVLAIPRLYTPFAEAAGLTACAVRPDIDPGNREVLRRIMDPLRGAEYLIRDLMMPVVEQAYEDLDQVVEDGDVLVSHPLTYAAPVLAEKRGIRWASSVLAPLGFFSQEDPPLMAVHPAAAALQGRLPGIYRRLVPLARVATRSWGKRVHALRHRLGLPAGADPVHAGQFSPYLNVAMFSRLLAEQQRDWPPNTVVTGAVSYDAVLGGLSESLQAFLDAGSPPIVFTLGTSAVAAASAVRFYQTSIEAARAASARAVLLVGKDDGHRPDTGGRSDVFVADWAPHSELFARASVIVHQGGAGTLHTALASGRPMLIVPHAHDQGDNAVRAARLGVARVVFPSQYKGKAVRDHLRLLSSEPSYRERAEAVGAVVSAERGAERAVGALESLVRSEAEDESRPGFIRR